MMSEQKPKHARISFQDKERAQVGQLGLENPWMRIWNEL